MIEHIRTVGFKGFDIDEDVPQKVIYRGKNMSGKTTRASAISLALCGYIPFSTAGKLPGDILESFGKESLVVAITIKGKEFARKFSVNKKGGVSQAVQIDKKTTSKDNFAIMLGKAGAPRIADVAEFMKQSDAKKVDTLFDLYPNEALAGIDALIEKDKEDVSRLEKKIKGSEAVVVQLTNSKKDIEIPAGSIAETQAEIKDVKKQISDFRDAIKLAEVEEARLEGEKKGKESGMTLDEAKKVISSMSPGEGHEQIKPANDGDNYSSMSGGHAFIDGGFPEVEGRFRSSSDEGMQDFKKEHFPQSFPTGNEVIPLLEHDPFESIQIIISALVGSGCGTCAALIIAKRELKKFQEVS